MKILHVWRTRGCLSLLAVCLLAGAAFPEAALDTLDAYRDPVFQLQALALARRALEACVGSRAPSPSPPHPLWSRQKGVFVSLEEHGTPHQPAVGRAGGQRA